MPDPEDVWNVKDYQQFLSSVPKAGEILIELLEVQQGERILDVGCGDGLITEKIQLRGGSVVGIDSSPEMIKAAMSRGINAKFMDAQNLIFDNEFDAVFSHATLHWLKDPAAALNGMAKALKTGGRLVAEFGVAGNVLIIESALIKALNQAGYDGKALSPWHHLMPDAYQAMLESNGLKIEFIQHTPRMIPLPGGMREWLKAFSRQFLASIPLSERNAILHEAEDTMRSILMDKHGVWHADYVRLWIRACKTTRA